MLSVDKNMKFNIPDLYPDIIRTGTVGEGSCFIHSVLKGLNVDNYSHKTEKEKMDYVEDLRKKISDSITIEYYKNNYAAIASLNLSGNLSKFLKVLYKFIDNPEDFIIQSKVSSVSSGLSLLTDMINTNIIVFKMIATVMSEKEFVNIIENPLITSSNTIDEYIENYNNILFKSFIQKLDEEEVKLSEEHSNICKTKIKTFVYSTCNSIVEKDFSNYKKKLKNTGVWCSDESFGIVSDYLNVDVYFIDVNKKTVYVDSVVKRNRPSVIIGWINQNHFENIGVLEGKHITRLFEPDHQFIIKIKEELVKNKK